MLKKDSHCSQDLRFSVFILSGMYSNELSIKQKIIEFQHFHENPVVCFGQSSHLSGIIELQENLLFKTVRINGKRLSFCLFPLNTYPSLMWKKFNELKTWIQSKITYPSNFSLMLDIICWREPGLCVNKTIIIRYRAGNDIKMYVPFYRSCRESFEEFVAQHKLLRLCMVLLAVHCKNIEPNSFI